MGRLAGVPHTSLIDELGAVAVGTAADVRRFSSSDPEALEHLNREGYVVVQNLNATEVLHARELMWTFLEGTRAGINREEPSTWIRSLPNPYGIVWHHGVGHSRLAWFVRTRPRLLDFFARVWNTTDLITSFEGFSWLPPREYEADWKIVDLWFHTDQNGVSRPGRQTVQSFTSLYDQDASTGAFVVVPRSHRQHAKVTQRVYRARPDTPDDQQFLMLPANDPIVSNTSNRPPHLVRVKAGDSILWDSRAVHCSTPSLLTETPPAVSPGDSPRPARVVVYASLSPRRLAPERVLLERQRALCERQTCTHWPFDTVCLEPPSRVGEAPSDPITQISPLVKQLVGYTDRQIGGWLAADLKARARERPVREVVCPPPTMREVVATADALFATPHAASLVGEPQDKCSGRRAARQAHELRMRRHAARRQAWLVKARGPEAGAA